MEALPQKRVRVRRPSEAFLCFRKLYSKKIWHNTSDFSSITQYHLDPETSSPGRMY
jgi:hypothetical protein